MLTNDEETSCIIITDEYIDSLLSIFDRENLNDQIFEKVSNIVILLLFNKENLGIIIVKLKNKISEISLSIGTSVLVLLRASKDDPYSKEVMSII
jgi:hypothetical protein